MVAQTNYRVFTPTEAPTHEVVNVGPNRTLHIPVIPFIGKVSSYCINWRGDSPSFDAAYNEDFLALRAVRALNSYRFCTDVRPGAPLIVRAKDGQGDWQVSKHLRSDGLWEVVAVRVAGQECQNISYQPDLLDFVVWIAHLS